MSITIPALNDVSDILDSDLCIVTHSNGDSYKISGAEINNRNQAIIAPDATPLTLTGAPLKTGNIIRVYWKVDLTSANGATALALSYNNVSYNVKVPRNGALASFLPFDLGNSVYKYLQAYTTLELLYDGTQFILLGNPVLISTTNYTYTADGKGILDTVASGNMHSVTSNAVASLIKKEVHTNVTSNELGFVDLGLYATEHTLLSAYSGNAWVTAIVTDYDRYLALITDYQNNVLPNTTLDSITIVYT